MTKLAFGRGVCDPLGMHLSQRRAAPQLKAHLLRGRRVLELEAQALRAVQRQLDVSFAHAVEAMCETIQAGRKLIVTGIGKSGQVGAKIAATLSSTGAPSVVLDAGNASHGDLGMIATGDLILILSYSGETEEVARLLPSLKRIGTRIVALTGNAKSTLAREADLHINVHVPREACPMNLAPTSSSTAMLAVGGAAGLGLAARTLNRGADPYRVAGFGALAGLAAFTSVIFSAPMGSPALFALGVALVGFGAGLFAHGTLTASMSMAQGDATGLALGAWGAVQALAAGLAIAAGGMLSDTIGTLARAGQLGATLTSPATGYSAVYLIELFLLFATLVAIGPLVGRQAHEVIIHLPDHDPASGGPDGLGLFMRRKPAGGVVSMARSFSEVTHAA